MSRFVTHNRKDYLLLHDAWRGSAAAWAIRARHAGILCLPHNQQPHELFPAIDVFLRAGFPVANAIHTYDLAASWVRQPYQP
ncbi:MAG TPA: hypothetical protein VNL16_10010 [Chloroflexota bacterium]|nr:hypothetical protein [Chloroflexota bacterium]